MDLTDGDLAYLRSELGEDVDEVDLQDRYDRLGTVAAVALEVQRQRLSAVLAAPAGFTIPGVYSEDNGARIRAMQDRVAELSRLVAAGGDPTGGSSPVVTRRRVRPRSAR